MSSHGLLLGPKYFVVKWVMFYDLVAHAFG
uniref:Uncharacterized protein n=1 Tax=Rhizophora mucronata TaxID=61149 RepID=A0A2P2Q359_RHIMU